MWITRYVIEAVVITMISLPSNSIVLEGITGCGKSTLIRSLLENKEYEYCVINCNAPIYETTKDVRDALRQSGYPFFPEAYLHLFTRWMKLSQQKNNADMMLIDRFSFSNLVYLLARAEEAEVSVDVQKVRDQMLYPFGMSVLDKSTTVYLDCPAQIAQERTKQRSGRSYFDYNFQARARDVYLREWELYPYRKMMIDASGTPEYTLKQFMPCIEKVKELKEHGI